MNRRYKPIVTCLNHLSSLPPSLCAHSSSLRANSFPSSTFNSEICFNEYKAVVKIIVKPSSHQLTIAAILMSGQKIKKQVLNIDFGPVIVTN